MTVYIFLFQGFRISEVKGKIEFLGMGVTDHKKTEQNVGCSMRFGKNKLRNEIYNLPYPDPGKIRPHNIRILRITREFFFPY